MTTDLSRSSDESSILDLLRTVAVGLVLVDHILDAGGIHAEQWLAQRLGWMGVMLFFVHTSLVLMMSLERSRVSGWPLLKYFYIRRAFRIYPLSIAVVLLVVVFNLPVASASFTTVRHSFQTVGANLLLAQNLFYAPSVLGPLWSLPLEVEMYVVLPFLFWMVGRGKHLGMAVVLWVLSMAVAVVQPYISDRANVAQFVPCFMGGVLAFCLLKRQTIRLPFWSWTLALFIVMIAFMAAETAEGNSNPMFLSWLLCVSVGLLIPHFRETRSEVIRRTTALVARYSYGIYLLHMLAFWMAFTLLRQASFMTRVAVGLGLTGAMAIVAYHALEAPAIRLGTRIAGAMLGRPAPASVRLSHALN